MINTGCSFFSEYASIAHVTSSRIRNGVSKGVAVSNTIPSVAWQLYGATLIWILIYDTEYALVDREDDLKIPIYSTAILFGKADRLIIGILQIMFISWMAWIGYRLNLGLFFNLSLFATTCLFLYQQILLVSRKKDAYFRSFLNNNWVGLVIFLGVMLYSTPIFYS